MLIRLEIRNYAIIDHVILDWKQGFQVITGETGAGKSILLGALGLVLGDRAEANVLFSAQQKCIIEAEFLISDSRDLSVLFERLDLEPDNSIILRREISTSGKSRSFINDNTVNLQDLKLFASQLVDLHRQFDYLQIKSDNFQREALDAFAEGLGTFRDYSFQYKLLEKAKIALAECRENLVQLQSAQDYDAFRLSELEDADFKEQELEELEAQLDKFSRFGQAKQNIAEAHFRLADAEPSGVDLLRQIALLVENANWGSESKQIAVRLNSVNVELKDIASELFAILEHIDIDPAALNIMEERNNLGNKLLHKHQVQTTSDLIRIRFELSQKMHGIETNQLNLKKLENEVEIILKSIAKIGEKLTKIRHSATANFESYISLGLKKIGMPNARFKIELHVSENPQPYGYEYIEFLIDTNSNDKFEPIGKIASGGEMSRLMLVIKVKIADALNLPTLIFDEIDTGISGEAAKQVGSLLQTLGGKHQLIVITHQPQIAAKANAHWYVYKELRNDKIQTAIKQLSSEESLIQVAKMVGGQSVSKEALQIAQQMSL